MNRLITWSDAFDIGIADIDAHHKALAGLINELHETVHRRKGVEACRDAVEKLRRCALSHLDIEEKLVQGAGHPGFTTDNEEQRELIRQIDAMLARMDDANSNITFHGLHQLKVWLLAHVRHVNAAISTETANGGETGEGVKVFGLVLKRA